MWPTSCTCHTLTDNICDFCYMSDCDCGPVYIRNPKGIMMVWYVCPHHQRLADRTINKPFTTSTT